jgi:hypothetical protein
MKKLLILAVVLTIVLSLGVASVMTTSAQDNYAGHRPVLAVAEYITDPASGEEGRTVWLQRDLGNRQLDHDFVFGDPRRALFNGGYAGVTFGVNQGFQSTDSNLTNQIGWLYESVYVWDNEQCADLALRERAVTAGQPGIVQRFFQTGVINLDWTADLTQVGFLSNAQFPYFASSPNVLGVTFTLFWTDAAGELTDIDGNGKFDVAFREIYYNDTFIWADNGVEGRQPNGTRVFDFPTVAIHEVGHGFSQAHFGNIGRQNGVLIARPRAVMNAIYGGTLRGLRGTDRAGHCSNWAQWPNR